MVTKDYTSALRASIEQEGAKPKTQRMSYEYRAGQVGRVLETVSECTIRDLARLLGMSQRQMHDICNRMAQEGRISVRQVEHSNWFKHLISRRK